MKIHLYNLPSVDQYVNQLIASYITIQAQFSQGDILLADKINRLQQKSRHMIKNIDEFMNKNTLDPRVRYLYSARNKLSKFLFKINENDLIKNVNEMKQNESVFVTSPNKRKEHQMSNEKENNNNKLSRINDYNDHQRVVFENVNESMVSQDQYQSRKQSQNLNNNKQTYHQKHQQSSQVKPYKINLQSPIPQYKQTPKNNSLLNQGHNRTPSTRMKPFQQQQQQNEKQKFQPSFYHDYRIEKSRTPVKTSRKVQSFTPKNTNILSARQQQQQHQQQQNINQSSNIQKSNTVRQNEYSRKTPTSHRQQHQQKSDNKKLSTTTIITPRTRLNNSYVGERTPPKFINSSNKKSHNENSQMYINKNNRQNNTYENQQQQQQQSLTPRQQLTNLSTRQQGRPSSAMKSLANLIFTIKMTKQEYNQFKKIKQQHQGNNNSYIQQNKYNSYVQQ